MSNLFNDKSEFNDDISNWDVSNVTNMERMFNLATSFNQPLNNWDVSNVTNMEFMFEMAESFNQPLSSWNVSNVTNMRYMFQGTESFNQDLSSWNIDYKILGIYKPSKKKINVTQLSEFELDKECHICQNTETNNNIIKVNCCNNNYHKDCLIKWLHINKTCPTCRNKF
jgi:surface protein